jgi:hypothetical protein
MKIVANGFTYDTGNFKVNVGDTVLLPYPSWHPDNGRGDGLEGVVEKIGSDYKGYLRPILGVVKRVAPPVAPVPVPANVAVKSVTKDTEPVTVKEIEKLVREGTFLVIDGRAFRYVVLGNGKGGWVELS